MARVGELWGCLRGILQTHPTFSQIKILVGAAGLPVERLAHIQQGQSHGASKGQLMEGIDGLVNDMNDERRDQFVTACTGELLRRHGHLREEVEAAFGRLGWGLNEMQPCLLTAEKYFPAGSHCDVQIFVSQILKSAQRSIWIYDPYMDEKVVEELTVCTANDIRLVTKSPQGVFKQRLAALVTQMFSKGVTVATKISAASHDRFFIIDEQKVWTLGTSLNHAGSKATYGHEVQAVSERDKIINDFKQWWTTGTTLNIGKVSTTTAHSPAPAATKKQNFLRHIRRRFLTTAGKVVIGVVIAVLGAWAIVAWGPQSKWFQAKSQTASLELEKAKIEVYQVDSTGQYWRVCHFPIQIYNPTVATLSVSYWKLTDLHRLENGSFSPWGEVDTLRLEWPERLPKTISPGDRVSVPFARIFPADLQKALREGRRYSGDPDKPQIRFMVVPGGWARKMTSHIPPGTYHFKLSVFFEKEPPAEADVELEWAGQQRENVELMAQEIKLRKLAQ